MASVSFSKLKISFTATKFMKYFYFVVKGQHNKNTENQTLSNAENKENTSPEKLYENMKLPSVSVNALSNSSISPEELNDCINTNSTGDYTEIENYKNADELIEKLNDEDDENILNFADNTLNYPENCNDENIVPECIKNGAINSDINFEDADSLKIFEASYVFNQDSKSYEESENYYSAHPSFLEKDGILCDEIINSGYKYKSEFYFSAPSQNQIRKLSDLFDLYKNNSDIDINELFTYKTSSPEKQLKNETYKNKIYNEEISDKKNSSLNLDITSDKLYVVSDENTYKFNYDLLKKQPGNINCSNSEASNDKKCEVIYIKDYKTVKKEGLRKEPKKALTKKEAKKIKKLKKADDDITDFFFKIVRKNHKKYKKLESKKRKK